MKFSRLHLVGFKSFCDPADLLIQPGLTGVVGPNGCGKSNLLEAMRWVMGENSYKNMRASGMDEVIFSGSANRPSRNMAEATLVLDNTDRTAPTAFNGDDVLEVTRRIERGDGSVYRINGKEVRARDVQQLFADVSTGARSPSMVQQGQIGALVSARPAQRRLILEEAAGISGLHARRHEAELRLRAAESNLERVDDIIATVATHLQTLKRQAGQAQRYRRLSAQIRKAEAGLAYLRWRSVRDSEAETRADHMRTVQLLAEANHADLETRKRLDETGTRLRPLRQIEAEAAAALQRLQIALAQLEKEAGRNDQRKTELEGRLAQIHIDKARDARQIEESRALLDGLAREEVQLNADANNAEGDRKRARQDADRSGQGVSEAETALNGMSERLNEIRAHRSSTERGLNDAGRRLEKLDRQIADLSAEAAGIDEALCDDSTAIAAAEALDLARTRAANAEAAAERAEAETRRAEQDLEQQRSVFAALETGHAGLEAEAKAITAMLDMHDRGSGATVVDGLEVEQGYETVLGAAIGDDLNASPNADAARFWMDPGADQSDFPLPDGVTSLLRFVRAPGLLQRRLKQIGVVGRADGARLMRHLKPGQMLVTTDGDLWRWDGFVARGDAPSASAQRLAQRNRLAVIVRQLAEQASRLDTSRSDLESKSRRLANARDTERQCRAQYKTSRHEISSARAALEAVQKSTLDLTARRKALDEVQVRLRSSRDEARLAVTKAEKTYAALDDDEEISCRIEALTKQLRLLREQADKTRLRLAGFENAAHARTRRLEKIAAEQQAWQQRFDDAKNHSELLLLREREIVDELAEREHAPQKFLQQRQTLEIEIVEAERKCRHTADAVAGMENEYREQDRQARDAGAALSRVREDIARIEERMQSLAKQRIQSARDIDDAFDVTAERLAAVAGLDPEQQLPAAEKTGVELDRLRLERKRLGSVNLRAEQEAVDMQEKHDIMIRDREDTVAAIAKLRAAISSLNREGRARLTSAFDKVNAHFRDLFTDLFGGGTAELRFIESADPLDAGLEIIARPPGKKPQSITLLSGGEQALTALSLIFAVFLTNPAPVCVLDEVDAPLDDANVARFCNLLDSMRKKTATRFVVITHNPITMARMDRLFGVTMAERGVSTLVSVDLEAAEQYRETG